MRAVVVTLVASIVLAGCAGSEGGSEATDDTVAGVDRGVASDARGLVWSDGEPVRKTLHEEGTFAATEYCIGVNLPSCILDGGSGEAVTDITDALPVGMPSRVTVVHEYEGGTVGLHDIGFNNGCGAYWFASEGRPTQGPHVMGSERIVFDIMMAPCHEDAETRVAVYPIVSDPQPETSWTLDVTVAAEPAKAMPGLPVVVPIDGNVTGFEARTGTGEGAFLLWGPDDTFLGRHSTSGGTASFPAEGDAAQGDHVLVVASDSPPLQVNLTGAAKERPFNGLGTFDWRPVGTAQMLDGPGPVTWTFDVDETALGVILALTVPEPEIPPFEAEPGAYTGIDARIDSPAGTVLDTRFECAACLPFFGGSTRAQSEPGHPAMEAGTFTASLEYDASVRIEAQVYTFHYAR